MGSLVSSHMDAVMQKNMDNMAEMQQAMLERQIQMNNYMRETQMAMQIARQRELFTWCSAFMLITVPLCFNAARKLRTPSPIVPLVPLTFLYLYQADMAIGNKMDRIRADADRILQEEIKMLSLPGPGLPTVEILDERRKAVTK